MKENRFSLLARFVATDPKNREMVTVWMDREAPYYEKGEQRTCGQYAVEKGEWRIPNGVREPANPKLDSYRGWHELVEALAENFIKDGGFRTILLSAASEGEDRQVFSIHESGPLRFQMTGGSCSSAYDKTEPDYRIDEEINELNWYDLLRMAEHPGAWTDFEHVWTISRLGEHLAHCVHARTRELEKNPHVKLPAKLNRDLFEIFGKDAFRFGLTKSHTSRAAILESFELINFGDLSKLDDFLDVGPRSFIALGFEYENCDPEDRFRDEKYYSNRVLEIEILPQREAFEKIGRLLTVGPNKSSSMYIRVFSSRAAAKEGVELALEELGLEAN